jgi:hypothetical protein
MKGPGEGGGSRYLLRGEFGLHVHSILLLFPHALHSFRNRPLDGDDQLPPRWILSFHLVQKAPVTSRRQENTRLKRLVAELSLEKQVLGERS